MEKHKTEIMKKTLLLISLLLGIALTTCAQKIKKVEGTYTYYAPGNVGLDEAKRIALDRAKTQALADAFGTIVAEYNTVRTDNQSGQSNSSFSSIGGTEVKGEWIETTEEPVYAIKYEDNMLVVTCKVEGRAREITSAALDLQVRILRNGTENRFEAEDFRNNDDLYLSFQSPVEGYLAVYLVDADRQAFCLLPYRGQKEGIYPIVANRHYIFFNEQTAPVAERTYVDEYTMTCEREAEHNQIYVIFSPNPFAKAVDANEDDGLPRQLSFDDFNRWLVKHRKRDAAMNVVIKPIVVKK